MYRLERKQIQKRISALDIRNLRLVLPPPMWAHHVHATSMQILLDYALNGVVREQEISALRDVAPEKPKVRAEDKVREILRGLERI